MQGITIQEARAVERFSPGQWTVSEVDGGGWTVRRGDTVLYAKNGRQPRIFRSLDTVIRNLREEIGVTAFQVEAQKEETTGA
jgi:hypothetical protein